MTNDQEALAQRIAEERTALKAAMKTLPFDFNTAGATRIAAWKMAHANAQGVLNRNPMNTAPYVEARRRIQSCGAADVAALAKEMWDE